MTDTPFTTLATSPEVSSLSSAVDGVDRLDVRPLETTPPEKLTPVEKLTPLEKLTPFEKTVAVERIDGAGEPCPAPLVWQEIRENYLRDSTPWELDHGPHRLTGRTWGVGRPLYFLNHYAGTAELFSLTAWLLKDQFRCVLFDTMTVAPHANKTLTLYCDDLFAIADQHGDQRFHLFGAGFGAAVGLQAAFNQPGRIASAVLQQGFAIQKLSFFERLLISICLRSSKTLDSLPQRRRFQAVNHQPWFPPFDTSRFEFLIESTGKLLLRDLALRAVALRSFDLSQKLGEIRLPVMLIRTEGEGRIAAESQQQLEKQLKSCRVEWLHSAGQHPCLTHPHRVAKLIQAFCIE
jgi:pimeloyl-ACP methyl ester carboxylesterase